MMKGKLCPVCSFTNVQSAVCCGSCGADISSIAITDMSDIDYLKDTTQNTNQSSSDKATHPQSDWGERNLSDSQDKQIEIDRKKLAQTYETKADYELLDLHSAGTLTNLAYEVLEAELTARDVAIPQRPETPVALQSRPQSLKAHWEGKANLASAYWGIGVGGGIVFAFLTKLLGSSPIGILILFAWVPYTIFALVSIWRCSWNSSWEGWGYIARTFVILKAFYVVFLFFNTLQYLT